MQSVVITGASTGIGWATAKPLLDRGFRVFGSVRKPADANRLTHFPARNSATIKLTTIRT
jgi:NAD(P)-dependent dehydrogenase (short-subunit alcohol dehydrogenase family)